MRPSPSMQLTLKSLRLSGVAESLEVRLDQAREASLGYLEFLQLILQDEVGHVFAQVLADAGVYKMDEAGRAGFVRFLASVQ